MLSTESLVERMRLGEANLKAEPYLHFGEDRVYNPLTDRLLLEGEVGYGDLLAIVNGTLPIAREAGLSREPGGSQSKSGIDLLAEAGWLVEDDGNLDRRFHLKYVALETHTVCNQSCYFCPVAFDPREAYFMPGELFRRLVEELAGYRSTLEAVFLMSYNEPTLDRRFVDQCRAMQAAGLPTAVNTNGSGLTPAKIDALVDVGPLTFLSVNLSTLDPAKYEKDRGRNQLDQVLRNLDYAKDKAIARQMVIMVLGTGDAQHDDDFQRIGERYAESHFNVQRGEVMDRAGYLQIGLKASAEGKALRGCENVGSRPLQHLHITPQGKCVLCCEDYDEHHVVGDLNEESIAQVLGGDAMAELRRWSYGLEEAPANFICRSCIFARTR